MPVVTGNMFVLTLTPGQFLQTLVLGILDDPLVVNALATENCLTVLEFVLRSACGVASCRRTLQSGGCRCFLYRLARRCRLRNSMNEISSQASLFTYRFDLPGNLEFWKKKTKTFLINRNYVEVGTAKFESSRCSCKGIEWSTHRVITTMHVRTKDTKVCIEAIFNWFGLLIKICSSCLRFEWK